MRRRSRKDSRTNVFAYLSLQDPQGHTHVHANNVSFVPARESTLGREIWNLRKPSVRPSSTERVQQKTTGYKDANRQGLFPSVRLHIPLCLYLSFLYIYVHVNAVRNCLSSLHFRQNPTESPCDVVIGEKPCTSPRRTGSRKTLPIHSRGLCQHREDAEKQQKGWFSQYLFPLTAWIHP